MDRVRAKSGVVLRRTPRRFLVEPLERRTLLSSTWFVAKTGSDANPGTLAAPFLTIQHAADAAGPGDTVDVMAGVYHETVTVHHSGTNGAPIIFQPYNNQQVEIDGADPITGWTNAGGPISSAPMSWNLGEGNNQVFVDNQMINEARWPNTSLDLSHPTLATAASVSSTLTSATIKDAAITQGPGFWVGGTIRVGSGQNWVNQTGTVTASGVGFVTFSYVNSDPTWETPRGGNTFYLFGVAGALDAPGEFFRSSGGQLSVWTPSGDSPANHVVEAKARQYGFDVSNASYVRIQGFEFFACSVLTSSRSTQVVINHVSAEYLQQFAVDAGGWVPPTAGGIMLCGSSDVLENSVIAWSAGDGVFVAGGSDTVTNNLIHDVDYAGVDAAPIRIGGWNDIISHNTIYNAGRNGLLFSGSHATITYNNVSAFGLQTTDVGGFYTYGSNGANTRIAYNVFHGMSVGGYGEVGIYFDGGESNFVVDHNITWGSDTALRMTRVQHNMLIYNNTFDALTWGQDIDNKGNSWAGVILENNIFTHPVEFGMFSVNPNNISNHGQFVDAAQGNFTLLPGAPAVDTGLFIPPYTNGYVGVAPDIGALELGLPAFVTGATMKNLPPDPSEE